MKASIALQVLPLSQGIDRIAVIDRVIAYLQAQSVTMVVTPFETVLEGEFDELMRILKEALEVVGRGADNVFANVKINVGDILSIDEKLEKYDETTDWSFGLSRSLVGLAVSGNIQTFTQVYPANSS